MDFKELYRQKLKTPEAIAAEVRPGWSLCSDIGLAIPYAICDAIGGRAKNRGLFGVSLNAMLDTGPLSFFEEEHKTG